MQSSNRSQDSTRLRLEDSLQRHLSWIESADNKAVALFAIDMALLGVLGGVAPVPSKFNWSLFFCIAIAIGAILCSIVGLAWSLYPRLGGPGGSLLYFDDISKMRYEDFRDKMSEFTDYKYEEDLARQVFRNAEIASQKYKLLRAACTAMMISAPFWFLGIYLSLRMD